MANLTQLKMLEDLNAVLLVDKPAGIAFSTVAKTVKRKFNLVKVGHGGSLDTAASGLLVLLINDANKYVGDIMGADRTYSGTMKLGVKTNTGDMHGTAVSTSAGLPSASRIVEALPDFLGDVFQTEPRFCSVRREGAAEYEIADTGEHKPILVHVWDFKPGELSGDALPFEVSATKGLIVRALANDFGDALGCGAALDACRRTRIGTFKVEDAIKFGDLLNVEIGDFASCTIPLAKALR